MLSPVHNTPTGPVHNTPTGPASIDGVGFRPGDLRHITSPANSALQHTLHGAKTNEAQKKFHQTARIRSAITAARKRLASAPVTARWSKVWFSGMTRRTAATRSTATTWSEIRPAPRKVERLERNSTGEWVAVEPLSMISRCENVDHLDPSQKR